MRTGRFKGSRDGNAIKIVSQGLDIDTLTTNTAQYELRFRRLG